MLCHLWLFKLLKISTKSFIIIELTYCQIDIFRGFIKKFEKVICNFYTYYSDLRFDTCQTYIWSTIYDATPFISLTWLTWFWIQYTRIIILLNKMTNDILVAFVIRIIQKFSWMFDSKYALEIYQQASNEIVLIYKHLIFPIFNFLGTTLYLCVIKYSPTSTRAL